MTGMEGGAIGFIAAGLDPHHTVIYEMRRRRRPEDADTAGDIATACALNLGWS